MPEYFVTAARDNQNRLGAFYLALAYWQPHELPPLEISFNLRRRRKTPRRSNGKIDNVCRYLANSTSTFSPDLNAARSFARVD